MLTVLHRLVLSWRGLGAILARLGAILGRPGGVLTCLGAILGRLGRVLASQNRPPDELRHRKKPCFSLVFSMFLCSEGFGQDPGRSWPKELSKTPPRRPEELPRRPQERPRPPQETFR